MIDDLFLLKLERFERASIRFAELILSENGSEEQKKAGRIYIARREDLINYVEKGK